MEVIFTSGRKFVPNYDRSWMRKARTEMGLTQDQVAHAVGVSVGNYCQIERGCTTPAMHAGIRICDFLGVDVKCFANERRL